MTITSTWKRLDCAHGCAGFVAKYLKNGRALWVRQLGLTTHVGPQDAATKASINYWGDGRTPSSRPTRNRSSTSTFTAISVSRTRSSRIQRIWRSLRNPNRLLRFLTIIIRLIFMNAIRGLRDHELENERWHTHGTVGCADF